MTKESKLYCMNCGGEAFPILRPKSHIREKHHRKKLYCWHCRKEVNHIECRTPDEIKEFKQNYNEGKYREEANKSMLQIENENIFRKRDDNNA